MHGILNVNKPSGPTSHDVISIVRRAVGQKKVGHAGTLDPAASGVLVVCLGDATRIVEYLMHWPKEYRAVAQFGVGTDSEDQTGNVVRRMNCPHVTRELVESVIPRFLGKIQQIPPMMSAVHHAGQRLYQLARAGHVVERTPRTVEIHSLKLVEFFPADQPRAVFEVQCSKGTYIRTLCADIGLATNCVAHMASLVRTRVGPLTLDRAVSLENIKEGRLKERLDEVLLSIDDALNEMPSITISAPDADRVKNGVILTVSSLTLPLEVPLRIHDPCGSLLAIGMVCKISDAKAVLKPVKVFCGS